MKVCMIDNYDSFTFNVVQYLGELGAEVETHRNDAITLERIEAMAPSHLVISPGPCTPDRKSTRLNSSHVRISYAVFCLKKKKKKPSTLPSLTPPPTHTPLYHHTPS